MDKRLKSYVWAAAGTVTVLTAALFCLPGRPVTCCTLNPLAWDSTTWSAITALATILLVIFASLAWIISRKTLQTAKEDALEARNIALASMETQQRSQEIAALSKYVHSLTELSEILSRAPAKYHVPIANANLAISLNMDLGYPSYLDDLCRNVEVSGALWRIYHPSIDGMVSQFASFEYFFIESVRIWTKMRDEGDRAKELFELNFGFGKILASHVRAWQSYPTHRDRIAELLPGQLLYFREEIETISGTKLV